MTPCWHSISLYKSCIVYAKPGPKPNTSTISARAVINSILLQTFEDPIVGEEDATDLRALTNASQVLHADGSEPLSHSGSSPSRILRIFPMHFSSFTLGRHRVIMRPFSVLLALFLVSLSSAALRHLKLRQSITPPHHWINTGRAPSADIIQLRIALSQPRFPELERHSDQRPVPTSTNAMANTCPRKRLKSSLHPIQAVSMRCTNGLSVMALAARHATRHRRGLGHGVCACCTGREYA
jgi:hypothetical protein